MANSLMNHSDRFMNQFDWVKRMRESNPLVVRSHKKLRAPFIYNTYVILYLRWWKNYCVNMTN